MTSVVASLGENIEAYSELMKFSEHDKTEMSNTAINSNSNEEFEQNLIKMQFPVNTITDMNKFRLGCQLISASRE